MAQAAPPSMPYGAPIDIAAAKTAMAAAEACATRNKWGVAIAIVDSGANLVMLHRLDNAQLSSVRIAEQRRAPRPSSAGRPKCSRMRWPAAVWAFAC
jgi:hypothetical protein